MENKQAIIKQLMAVRASLVQVSYLATQADLGSSQWFCDGYPFGMDLDEFTAQLAEYIDKLTDTVSA